MDKEPELVVKILEEELDLAAKEFAKQYKGGVFYDASGRIAPENADWVRGWFLKRADVIRNKVDGEGASDLTGGAGD